MPDPGSQTRSTTIHHEEQLTSKLRLDPQSGLDMKLIGHTGAVIIKVPAAYVQGFSTRLKILTANFG